MHYKNSREAKFGDSVIGQSYGGGTVIAGVIHSLIAGPETCNCAIAVPVMGGVNQLTCQSVSNFYHAEDAFAAMEALQPKPVPLEEKVALAEPTPAPAT